MHVTPTSVAATLLRREDLVAQCMREQWVAQALMDADRQQHHAAIAESEPVMSARLVVLRHTRHVMQRIAAVFGPPSRVTTA